MWITPYPAFSTLPLRINAFERFGGLRHVELQCEKSHRDAASVSSSKLRQAVRGRKRLLSFATRSCGADASWNGRRSEQAARSSPAGIAARPSLLLERPRELGWVGRGAQAGWQWY